MEGTFDPASKDYPKAIGVDYASGASNTAIVGLCYVDDKLVVTYSREFEEILTIMKWYLLSQV